MFAAVSFMLLGAAILGNAYFIYKNIQNSFKPDNPIKGLSIAAAAIGVVSMLFAAFVLGTILL